MEYLLEKLDEAMALIDSGQVQAGRDMMEGMGVELTRLINEARENGDGTGTCA